MCLCVFIASDAPLPIVVGDGTEVCLEIDELAGDVVDVRRILPQPYVLEATYGGCGCGLEYDEYLLDDDTAASRGIYESGFRTISDLRAYIANGVAAGPVQVYACWWGDWVADPIAHVDVTLDYFGGSSFNFTEKQLLTVSA